MNDQVIREAVAGDATQIIVIHARSVRALCSGDYTPEQIEAWIGKRTPEEMAQRIAMHPFFVAERNGKLTGYAVYNVNSSELLSIYVDPDFARQGVASALMNVLLADAWSKGLATLWLDASLSAVPFYETVGFVRIMETTHAFRGVPLECMRMEMSLTG
jgi:putative acetyltransferase